MYFDSRHLVFVALALAACSEEARLPEPAPGPVASTCGEVGYLKASLSGALDADVDWPDGALVCESMLRPEDRGVRLRFSGLVGAERLTLIIAMPTLTAGATGPEFDSVVTITVEGSGRFFSTPNLGSCWTDVRTNSPLEDGGSLHIVAGELSCVAPLGEINGSAFIDLRDFGFSGVADWGAS